MSGQMNPVYEPQTPKAVAVMEDARSAISAVSVLKEAWTCLQVMYHLDVDHCHSMAGCHVLQPV